MLLLIIFCALSTCLVVGEKDCQTGGWGSWDLCSPTEVEVLLLENVGKQIRKREEVAGMFCQDRDLREVKLCRLQSEVKQKDGDSGDKTNKSVTEEGRAVGTRVQNGEIEAISTQDSPKQDPGHIKVFNVQQKSVGESTDKIIFIVLICLTTVLLGTGSLFGLLLVRSHKKLQRKHRILVMTRERIRLIDGERIPVRQSGSWLCGVGKSAGLLCGLGVMQSNGDGEMVHNPTYESEDENLEVEAKFLSTGRLQLKPLDS